MERKLAFASPEKWSDFQRFKMCPVFLVKARESRSLINLESGATVKNDFVKYLFRYS